MDEYDNIIDFKPQQVEVSYRNCFEFEFINSLEQIRFKNFFLDRDEELNLIFIFDTEKECIECYNDLVWTLIKRSKTIIRFWENRQDKFKGKFINTDYLIEKLRRGE